MVTGVTAQRAWTHLRVAHEYANLSHSRKSKVGAIIVRDDRVISVGYNGTVAGADNCCEYSADGKYLTYPSVVHAEMNAIAFAARHGTATDGCVMYLTLSPCFDCAKLIVQSGIVEVIYDRQWHKGGDSIQFLNDNGVLTRAQKDIPT